MPNVTCPRCHGEGTEPRNAARPCTLCGDSGMVPAPLSPDELEAVYVDDQITLHLTGEDEP